MNSNDLAECLAAEFDISKVSARIVVQRVLTTIVTAATNGEEVALSGFGKFKLRVLPAREGRNPATGEKVQIAASRRLTFTTAKAVRNKLNS